MVLVFLVSYDHIFGFGGAKCNQPLVRPILDTLKVIIEEGRCICRVIDFDEKASIVSKEPYVTMIDNVDNIVYKNKE